LKCVHLRIFLICALLLFGMLLSGCVSGDYDKALTLMENGDFSGAKAILELHPDFKDTPDLLELCRIELDYAEAERLFSDEEFAKALELYNLLGTFRASKEQASICSKYLSFAEAVSLAEAEKWSEAGEAFASLGSFLESEAWLIRCQSELFLINAGELLRSAKEDGGSGSGYILYTQALDLLNVMPDLPATCDRAENMRMECVYNQSVILLQRHAVQAGDNVAFSALAEQFASYGEYENAAIFADVLGALATRNAMAFTESLFKYEEEIAAVADPRDLYERFFDWDISLDESLALLSLYNRFEGYGTDDMLKEIEPEYRWGIDAGEWIYDQCSEAEGAKLLILTRLNRPDNERYIIPLSVMSALPDDLRISSFDDAGFILLINYDYTSDGTYDIGTKGIRESVEITLHRSNDRAVIKSWAKVYGRYSPESFDYSGEPPLYISGGAPDPEKALANFLEAIAFLGEGVS